MFSFLPTSLSSPFPVAGCRSCYPILPLSLYFESVILAFATLLYLLLITCFIAIIFVQRETGGGEGEQYLGKVIITQVKCLLCPCLLCQSGKGYACGTVKMDGYKKGNDEY